MSESGNETLVTVHEALEVLKISEGQLRKLFRSGEIKPVKIGPRGVRVARSELNRFIREQLGDDVTK